MTNVNIKPTDTEVLWVQPEATGQRVPTAQELAASSHLHAQSLSRAQKIERPAGLRSRPDFTAASLGVTIGTGLYPFAPGHPALAPTTQPITFNLPALSNIALSISRYDYVSLMVGSVVINENIDPDIRLTFSWQSQSNLIQELTKENTRRLRTVWWLVSREGAQATETSVINALPTVNNAKKVTVIKSTSGVVLSGHQFYFLDPNLVENKEYEFYPDSIVAIDLLRVWRSQNYTQNGYVWGRNGEAGFEGDYHLQPTYNYVGEGWQDWAYRARNTLRRVCLGLPITNSPKYDRLVCNLINGQVATNLVSPGLATASPNGSTALANGQRVVFSNQAVVQKSFCSIVATIAVDGVAQATVPFQVNSPIGSRFSEKITDHKVYRADGLDVTQDGVLTGLGGTGALTWKARNTTIVAPGDTVYVVPGIYYPSGSGFPASGAMEKVFLDNVQLNVGNIREASIDDLTAYAAPANSENFIVVVGKERAACHYVFRKFTVTSDAQGIARIPANTNGVFAFLSGANAPAGRIEKPIATGLTPSTNYSALCYYPPKVTEQWQFQIKTTRYAGSGELAKLNGTIATKPITIAHSHGAGNGVFQADGDVQYEAIALRLPSNTLSSAVKAYQLYYKIQFLNEPHQGDLSYREDVPLYAGNGFIAPRAGIAIAATAATNPQAKGLAVKLTSEGRAIGIQKQPILCAQFYQLAIGFIVLAADGSRRLAIATINGGDPSQPSPCALDSDLFAGIDTFPIY
jgi:hypothetical protein